MSALRSLLSACAAFAIRALGATWRLQFSGPAPSRMPFVLVTWHQGLLIAAYALRDRALWVPLSLSRDGDRAESVLLRLGFARSPRGSSSRGGSALLREMIRRVRAGESGGVLPDGPRGPAFDAKLGVLALAAATGAQLVPVGVAAAPVRRLGSWDRALLPLPIARVAVRYGNPLEVPRSANATELETWRAQLCETLHRLDREAEAQLKKA